MILIGLTGGIGSGKSTVSSLLAEHGAVIIDADAITRELQVPGAPLLTVLAERFGQHILDANGGLIREELAKIAFSDPEALKDLNKIVHPAVAKEMDRRMNEVRATDKVVILDIPLLAENPRKGLCGVIVVDVPVEIAVSRLVEFRNMKEDDAQARIAKQASREDRLKIADKVIDNSGDMSSLAQQVDDVWVWAQQLPAAADDAGDREDTTTKSENP
ncbi:MAG: dephospho-CoA kinase [Actinomycetota bacterium]|jgi:dephospho-CoA kinase